MPKSKRPKQDQPATLSDPHAEMLVTLQNVKLKHSRRAAEARWCLKQGLHRPTALAVLRAIVSKPDKSMLKRQYLDMARRTLIRYDTEGKERPIYLLASKRRHIDENAARAAHGREIVWTGDAEQVRRCMDELK